MTDSMHHTSGNMSTSSVVDLNDGVSRKGGCIRGLKPNREKARHVCEEWFKDPLNVVLFVWLCVVFVCAIAFFLSLSGLLDNVLHNNKSWIELSFEVPNQTLNALFTLLCIYVHPTRFYHLFLLCRWRPDDIIILRKEYCKDGTYKPKEWANMMIVVILLHVNCFAQYALCGLNMAIRKPDRPVPVLAVCLVVSVAAPVTAVILMNHGTLGKDHIEQAPRDEEAQNHHVIRMAFVSRNEPRIVEEKPEWAGGLMDICDDKSAASLSFFCCFCVFGWNMERLGLGNMYVHVTTFLLICTSPVGLFYLATAHIEHEAFSKALQLVGVILSLLGLLHGGVWRIKMRKEYNLPPDSNACCCGNASMADCAKWLFCCWCSLAQEVRTGNYYDIVERAVITPQKDDGNTGASVDSVQPALAGIQLESSKQPGRILDTSNIGQDKAMIVPVTSVIQRGETCGREHSSPSSKNSRQDNKEHRSDPTLLWRSM